MQLIYIDINHRDIFVTHSRIAAERLSCELPLAITIDIDDEADDSETTTKQIKYIEENAKWMSGFVIHHRENRASSDLSQLSLRVPFELWKEAVQCAQAASVLHANSLLTSLDPRRGHHGINFSW